MEERDEEIKTMIGGDFNARTGEEGEWEEEEGKDKEELGRRSKDKKINKEGRKLLEVIEERGWMILNGNVKGDEEGEFTFTGGKSETIIDYVIGDKRVKERVERMGIGERIDSDHHPVIVWIKGRVRREERRGGGKRLRSREIWNEEGRKEFMEKIGKMGERKVDLQEELEWGMNRIRKVIEEREEERKKKG